MQNEEKHTILLVEDEPVIALAEKQSLEQRGYIVLTETTGEKAIEAARNNPDIDLILMDVDLGAGIDGTEAAEEILRNRELPVVFLSAHTEPEVVEKTEKITSYGYVVKNSTITVLDASIKMAFKLFKAHTTLKENEKRFQDLFENMSDAFALHEIILDAAGTPIDYRFLEANGVLLKRLGMNREELIGKRGLELFPRTEPGWVQAFGRVALTGAPEVYSHYAVELDRYYEAHLYCPQIGLVAGLFTDITERRQAESDLRDERRRLASIIEASNSGTWEWNVQTGETTFNERWASLIGYTLEELSPVSIQTWERLTHPEDLQRCNELLARHFRGETEFYEAECRMKHRNGDWVWILDRGRVISWTGAGDPLIVMGTHQDITSRKETERAMQENEDHIRRLVDEKETLLKEMQHRVKNNISTIASLLYLQASSLSDPAAVEALEDARSRLLSMEVLYERLQKAGSFQEISLRQYLSPLVYDVVDLFPPVKNVLVDTDVADVKLQARTLSSLGIVVTELVTNAMKHAFDGRDDGRLLVTAHHEQSRITVIVADNGNGLPDGFDIRASSSFGMTMIVALVEQLNGEIRVERTEGTRFILEFTP